MRGISEPDFVFTPSLVRDAFCSYVFAGGLALDRYEGNAGLEEVHACWDSARVNVINERHDSLHRWRGVLVGCNMRM